MSAKDELRQALLELHYELLDDDQAARWRAAIATDPEVASEWARTLRLAGRLADAAKIEMPSIQNSLLEQTRIAETQTEKIEPAATVAVDVVTPQPSSNGRPQVATDDEVLVAVEVTDPPSHAKDRAGDAVVTVNSVDRKPSDSIRWWLGSAMVAATAAAIGCLVIGSWYLERLPAAPTAGLRLQAQATPGHEARGENEFRFVTSRLDGSSSTGGAFPVTPASLSFSVLARGSVLFSGTTETNAEGTGRVVLPPELAIPEGAQLRVTARSQSGYLSESTLEVPLEPTRCLTYLTVDRPVYRPGETVFFRSLTLTRKSMRSTLDVPIRFELIDPSGAAVDGAVTDGVTDRGVGNGAFNLPSTAPGGPYTLVARSLDGFFPEERCDFQVRVYRVPRFKKDLDFRRRSYGPGETVEADFSAQRAEGGELRGAAVRVTARVDDQVIHQETTVTSPAGTCLISFTLPELIDRGVGSLSIAIDDGGTRETETKTIPIQLGSVMVDFHPEGGYLVGGLKNRVYFAARDTLGEPIHIAGEILSRSGQRVATIETVRDGMGRFEFVPQRGERYTLKVTQPVDITEHPKLPAVVNNLPVIDTGDGVFDSGQPIAVTLRSKTERSLLIRAVCRGRLVGQRQVDAKPGSRSVTLPVLMDAGGVIRVTLFDARTHRPLVERLVFRRQSRRLDIDVVEAGEQLERSPGQPLRLTLRVRDENGQPAPAVLGVSVVDDASLSLDDTERPTLSTHCLLTSEVQSPEDLEHANFYLSDDPNAGESLDLLLGTQGWRRFVSGSATRSEVDFREQLVRLLELDGDSLASPPPGLDSAAVLQQQWKSYRVAAADAWWKLLMEARLLMCAVLLIWLGAIVARMRQHAQRGLASWLLIATSSLLLYGCGVSETSMVVSEQADESALSEAANVQETDQVAADMDAEFMIEAPPTESAPEPTAPLFEEGGGDEGRMEAAEETPDANLGNGLTADVAEFIDGAKNAQGKALALGNRSRTLSEDELQQLLAARGLDAQALADQLLDELRFPVRQYAHQHQTSNSELREDFAETLYWQPMLITDSSGMATIRFDLSDSVTTFRVNIDGHAMDGRIGSGDAAVTSRLPLQIEPQLPLEVTTGDRIDLPVAVINATDQNLGVDLSLTADRAIKPVDDVRRMLSLGGHQRSREHFTLNVTEGSAETDSIIQIRGVASGSLVDTVRRPIHVSPAGYPTRDSVAGVINETAKVRLPIPQQIVEGSLSVTVRAFPSPLADVMSGIESILREPHGCFEQTSATNYPNAMAMLYLEENKIANPDVSRRARGMLDRGYQKLTSFECQQRGYEWFGSDPGHEALSAFGLMQFSDMARIMDVSQEMVARTRLWLMNRRDGKGGFQRNPRHLHVWSVQQPIVNAYVLWAITEADVAAGQDRRGESELSAELDQMAEVAMRSDDPYLIALSAAALLNVKRDSVGQQLLERLIGFQADDGSLTGETTVTSSGGVSLTMETTAIAALAWIKRPSFLPHARSATQWITANRQGGGGFGSTQATVLALKALVAMAGRAGGNATGGDLRVMLRGEEIGRATLPSEPRNGSTVEIKGLGRHLQDAEEDVEVELIARGSNRLSYAIDVAYHAITPKSNDACPLKLTTQWSGEFSEDGTVPTGDNLTVKMRLENDSDSGQPMTVAIVGIPGGAQPRVAELDELQEAGALDYYELRAREVIFYWRTIEPLAVKEIDFNVTATIPGEYTGPASRAYLYYTAEEKVWIEPLKIEITP
jgi:hypothetical protein